MIKIIRSHEMKFKKKDGLELADLIPEIEEPKIEKLKAINCKERKTSGEYNILYYVLAGGLIVKFGKEPMTAGPDDVVFIGPGEYYDIEGSFTAIRIRWKGSK
ncbi:hypothetical protein DRN74_03690 [Candidatus Micrarchaeota archaeon]|nr:MAG: hypothetical protein DRN74_03690 [Candidatus Micrarchaeota archaeon]